MSHPTLESTIRLAADKHEGMLDKGGAPYILHPLRVMLHMKEETQRHVALLHDVLEDSHVTLDDLRKLGYSEHIVTCLDALTRREESYDDFIARIVAAPLDARLVKLGDLEDNSDLSRIKGHTERDFQRFRKYQVARERLLASL